MRPAGPRHPGGRYFTQLDLAHAYAQLAAVTAETARMLTVTTHRGLFQVNRLAFGVSTAPAIFQRLIDGLLKGINHVVVLLDDILIAGETRDELEVRVEEVLSRLSAAGLRLKFAKCEFGLTAVTYLGHRVSAEGLSPLAERVRDLMDAPSPTCVQQLQSFVGKMAFNDLFMPGRAAVCLPLYGLLEKDTAWVWTDVHEGAFQEAKELLCSNQLLCHYSLHLPFVVFYTSPPCE